MSEPSSATKIIRLFNRPVSIFWLITALLALFKLSIHLFTYNHYELHRDAYLYYALGQHLDWGYASAPPLIGLIAAAITGLFGNSVFFLRLFPALIGILNVILMARMIRELGGRERSLLLAALVFILSPSFLHSNALFQPVSLNQFFWLLTGYVVLVMIRRQQPRYWLLLAMVIGVAFLNKYSISFLALAVALAMLFTPHRRLFRSKYFPLALALGFLIILPNLIWQWQHHWPVMHHMAELRETQLVHVQLSGFLIAQMLMNMQGIWLWLPALLILLFFSKESEYRLFGLIYIFVILLLIQLSGKPYYALGIYPPLFVFGAYFVEKYITKFRAVITGFILIFAVISLYISLSFDGIPFLPPDAIRQQDAFRWEDGSLHELPQDMADMTGWKDIGEKTVQIFNELSAQEKAQCGIYCEHYGQAGAVMFYGEKDHLPQPISYNDSFAFWAPDSLDKQIIIFVHFDDRWFEASERLPGMFDDVELKATIDNKDFRENGTQIYLCRYPTPETIAEYGSRMDQLQLRYNLE